MLSANLEIARATPEEIEAFTDARTEHCPHHCPADPIVSVCVPTYNHRDHIQKALESVLCQEASFAIELVIGDDASSDGTQEICSQFAVQYPQQVRLLRAKENLGKHTGNGRLNFLRLLRASRGKYLALLEGDDYWIDRDKLEKQVSMMEKNQRCVLSYSRVQYVDGSGAVIPVPDRFAHLQEQLGTLTLEHLSEGNLIHTPSVVLRNSASVQRDFRNQYIRNAPMGDWPLFLLSLREGVAIQHVDRLAAYRFSETSYWSALTKERARMYSAATRFLLAASGKFDESLTDRFIERAIDWHQDNTRGVVDEGVCRDFEAFLGRTMPFRVVLEMMGRLNGGLKRERMHCKALESRWRNHEGTVCYRARKAASRIWGTVAGFRKMGPWS